MRCSKCGFHSFEHLEKCRKCGQDLTAQKKRFHLRGFFAPGQAAPASAPEPIHAAEETPKPVAEQASINFGFDFLEEDTPFEEMAEDRAADEDRDINSDQPFGSASEAFSDDAKPATDETNDSDAKPGKGPHFAF
jgi:hypothetical protein